MRYLRLIHAAGHRCDMLTAPSERRAHDRERTADPHPVRGRSPTVLREGIDVQLAKRLLAAIVPVYMLNAAAGPSADVCRT